MESIIGFFIRYVFVFLLVAFSLKSYAQQAQNQRDTTKLITAEADTLNANLTDSLNKKSASGLNSVIEYHAEDSIRFSVDRSVVFLYGKARVSYEDMELSADYIKLDQKNKTMFSSGLNDKYGKYRGKPIFKQGQEPPVSTDSLVFNMESKKGLTYGSFTEVEGGYISAAQSKKNPYNEVSFRNGIYSTCNLPHPHFGIHISKGIVTQKQVISGPAYLEIEDIPVPVIMPFGFFPKTNKRSSGFRFPSFGEDATLGFYIRNVGWYFGINDYLDAEVLGTLYSKGSYNTNLLTRYRKNYKYNGQLNFAYNSVRAGIEGTPEYKPRKNFNLQWSHTQNQAANPGTNFGANVNIATSSYFQDSRASGSYDPTQLARTSLSSGINYSTTFGEMVSFSTSLRHNQDLATQQVDLELPSFTLSVPSINPFENKNRTGDPRWYEKISISYSMNGQNSISGKEYQLLDSALKNARNGINHAIPISMSFNAFKYLQFNTGISYNERWTLRTFRQNYDEAAKAIISVPENGFARNYDYSVNGGLATKFYGMKNFKKGNLAAIRHMVTPSASFSYRPDFGKGKYGFYREVQADSTGRIQRYSIFEGSGVGSPGSGKNASMSFSVDNTIEAKVKTKGDTANAFRKINILQGLNFTGSYNFLADSMKLSTISFSGRTAFFKEKLALNFGGSFDPYIYDPILNRTVNRFTFSNGTLARLTSFNVSTGFNFNSSTFKKKQENLAEQEKNPNNSQQRQQDISTILRNPNEFIDFTVPWSLNASYSFNYSKTGLKGTATNTLNFNGDFSLTPKWKTGYTSGWDFKQKTFSLTSFSIYRDLHCWDMSFTWVPFGMYKSFSFDLRVRASILQDLKLTRRSAYNPITL